MQQHQAFQCDLPQMSSKGFFFHDSQSHCKVVNCKKKSQISLNTHRSCWSTYSIPILSLWIISYDYLQVENIIVIYSISSSIIIPRYDSICKTFHMETETMIWWSPNFVFFFKGRSILQEFPKNPFFPPQVLWRPNLSDPTGFATNPAFHRGSILGSVDFFTDSNQW